MCIRTSHFRPRASVNGSAITWKSSNAKVITDAAAWVASQLVFVARQKTDTKVTLTATITDADGNTETKEFRADSFKAAVEQLEDHGLIGSRYFTGTEGSADPTSRCTSPPARMA